MCAGWGVIQTTLCAVYLLQSSRFPGGQIQTENRSKILLFKAARVHLIGIGCLKTGDKAVFVSHVSQYCLSRQGAYLSVNIKSVLGIKITNTLENI